jgi:hypothetical protein
MIGMYLKVMLLKNDRGMKQLVGYDSFFIEIEISINASF